MASLKLVVRLVENDGAPPWAVCSGEMKVARLETEPEALQVLHKLEQLQARANQRMVLVRSIESIKEDVMKKQDFPPKAPPKKTPKGGGKTPKC